MRVYKFPNGSLTYEGIRYKRFDGIAAQARKYPGGPPPDGFKVSFESFANYAADHKALEVHFASQTKSCQQVIQPL